ncbi:uncharacterized protein LOC129916123 [Episyrphus balteatus]|uniref:uncharacterized protein LOC129916123 n=1 Tax=Episyrphus balteatus TaxID=286459 RepID=UPI002486704E|nr:uncharacterized protein LOC129916123 [Episyrphus balteatus]XP_055851891.1 uncharacterized protein LOC129916123 [Episyrphus balteatus]
MHTLLRAYKCAKDNAGATGASPCTPPFYEEMEEIFGDKPIHTRSESINIGSVPPNVVQDPGASTSQQTPSMEVASQEREAENTLTEPATSVPDIAGSVSVVAASPPPIAVAAASARTPKESRNMSRSDFYKKNIQLRELEMAENKGQFEQRQKLKIRALEERQKRFDIKQKMFQERSNQ